MSKYTNLRGLIDSVIELAHEVRGEIDCVEFDADQYNELLDALRRAEQELTEAQSVATREVVASR